MLLSLLSKPIVSMMVDAKVVKERRYLLFLFGVGGLICFSCIATRVADSPLSISLLIMLCSLALSFGESGLASINVQQSRCSSTCQQDLTTFNIFFMGIGFTLGAVVAAVYTERGEPRIGFIYMMFPAALVFLSGFVLTDEVETNEFALVKDKFLAEYEQEQRQLHPELDTIPELPFWSRFCLKFSGLCDALKSPLIRRFYKFLIITGFIMPMYDTFDYYFALDVLKIRKKTIALQVIAAGAGLAITPIIYSSCCKNAEFQRLFRAAQWVYISAYAVKMCLAFRWTSDLGIPDYPVYFSTGVLASGFERCLTMMPAGIIMMKLLPPGLEATLLSVSNAIINMSMMLTRSMVAVIINDSMVNVTKDNLQDYKYLVMI